MFTTLCQAIEHSALYILVFYYTVSAFARVVDRIMLSCWWEDNSTLVRDKYWIENRGNPLLSVDRHLKARRGLWPWSWPEGHGNECVWVDNWLKSHGSWLAQISAGEGIPIHRLRAITKEAPRLCNILPRSFGRCACSTKFDAVEVAAMDPQRCNLLKPSENAPVRLYAGTMKRAVREVCSERFANEYSSCRVKEGRDKQGADSET